MGAPLDLGVLFRGVGVAAGYAQHQSGATTSILVGTHVPCHTDYPIRDHYVMFCVIPMGYPLITPNLRWGLRCCIDYGIIKMC